MEILRHNEIRRAAAVVRRGGVLVYATDTVWGLGGAANVATVAARVRQIKGKPADAPLIWLFPSVAAVEKTLGAVTPAERRLLRQKQTTVVVAGQGVRVIRHGWLNKLLAATGPLIATSANRHGQPPVTSWRQAVTVFGDQVDAVVRGRKIYRNAPSQVVVVENGETKIIRPAERISIR